MFIFLINWLDIFVGILVSRPPQIICPAVTRQWSLQWTLENKTKCFKLLLLLKILSEYAPNALECFVYALKTFWRWCEVKMACRLLEIKGTFESWGRTLKIECSLKTTFITEVTDRQILLIIELLSEQKSLWRSLRVLTMTIIKHNIKCSSTIFHVYCTSFSKLPLSSSERSVLFSWWKTRRFGIFVWTLGINIKIFTALERIY